MKRLFVASIGCLLAACATQPPARPADDFLFADARFQPAPEPVSSAGLFELSPEMRAFARGEVASRMGFRGALRGLFEALHAELQLDYDSEVTRPAAETFAARSGNCLSLVILGAAFAKELGVPFVYQEVHTDGAWSRAGGIAFYAGHVNLQLGRQPSSSMLMRSVGAPLTVDFLPSEAAVRLMTRPITEDKVVAMYFNNRAAEALVAGDVDAAYWWARAAVRAAPAYAAPYNTLGVVYRRHGDLAEAERAVRAALEREPANPNVLSNLVIVLEAQGRTDEAQAARAQLAAASPYPPFYFLDRGMRAAAGGDYAGALELYDRELERIPYDDELHFAIALAQLQLGHLRKARAHVAAALENSTIRERRQLYAAKLNYLRTLRN